MKKMSKSLALILSAIMLTSSIPMVSFAESTNNIVEEVKVEDINEELESTVDKELEEVSTNEESDESVNDEISQNPISNEDNSQIDNSSLTKGSYLYEVNYEQTKTNYREVTVEIPNVDRIISLNKADSVVINGNMSYKGTTVQKFSKKVNLSNVKNNSFKVDFPSYGKFEAQAVFYKNGKVVNTTNSATVGVVADEYNLAVLNATFPVVQFTLSLWDMKEDTKGEPVPTFVALSRSASYDWSKLPSNVYEMPYLTNRTGLSFNKKVDMMSTYVSELYELNPDSKFNLYTVDYTLKTYLTVIIKNNIPEENYTLKILSDGTASYVDFNEIFGGSNPQKVYDSMAAEWSNVKKQYSQGNYIDLSKLQYAYGNSSSVLRKYAYVIANEENNTEWWLARVNDTFNISDKDFLEKAKSCPNIRIKSISDMLKQLEGKGESALNEFKSLYHFSSSMFSEAVEKNKKVMMLLGTRVNLESNFSDYARFVKAYYGDDYVYYYKGHPATPTALWESKQKELSELGVTDVESSIAAELILFFYPDIYMSGYASTTFMSASEETACGLFDRSKEVGGNESYSPLLDFYINPLTDYSSEIGKLANKNHTNYLVEFQDEKKYDIAIWDATDYSIYYYKLENGKYKFVSKTATTAPNVTAEGGQNKVTLKWNSISGAKDYKVYSYDASTGKYKSIARTTKTSYTISGLQDGTTYTYLVRSYDGSTLSAYNKSNNVSATTFTSAPKVTAKSEKGAITLSWPKVKGATKYRIYSYSIETDKYTKITETDKNSYTVSNLPNGKSYTYLVRAYNGRNFNNYSKTKDNVTCKTLSSAPKTIANDGQNKITISWSKVTGATKYRVYSYNKSTKKYTRLVDTTATSYTAKNLSNGTDYTYLVRAYNGYGWSPYTVNDNVTCRTYTSSPQVKATGDKKKIKLSWPSVKGATKYRIYRYDKKTKKYTRLVDTTATSYTATGLSNNTTYTYLVRAYNGMTFSSYSTKNHVSAKTF